MEIKKVSCPACNGPITIKGDMNNLECPFCGTGLVVEVEEGKFSLKFVQQVEKTIRETGNKTSLSIQESTKKTQSELQKLQVQQKISTLQTQLTSINVEIRELERGRKGAKQKKQLNELISEKKWITTQIYKLENEINDNETVTSTQIYPSRKKSSGFKSGCLTGIVVYVILAVIFGAVGSFLDNLLFSKTLDQGPFLFFSFFVAFVIGVIAFFYKLNPNSEFSKKIRNLTNKMIPNKTPKFVVVGGLIFLFIICFGFFILNIGSGTTPEPIYNGTMQSTQAIENIQPIFTQEKTEEIYSTLAPTDSPVIEPLPTPIVFEDSKPNVFDLNKWTGAGLVNLEYYGSSNFIADALDKNGQSTSWGLVNEIGVYEGWAIIDEGGKTQTTRIEITNASGPYKLTIFPLSPEYTRSMDIPGIYTGQIPDVIFLNGNNPDLISFSYKGDSNFIVDAIDLNGNSTSWGLVNEIGSYEGKHTIPNNTSYIYVSHASGEYTIEVTTK